MRFELSPRHTMHLDLVLVVLVQDLQNGTVPVHGHDAGGVGAACYYCSRTDKGTLLKYCATTRALAGLSARARTSQKAMFR